MGQSLDEGLDIGENGPVSEELVLRVVLALENIAHPGLSWGNLIALSVGLGQCGLIAWGLWLMRQSARHRDQQYEENMLALRALIERTAQN